MHYLKLQLITDILLSLEKNTSQHTVSKNTNDKITPTGSITRKKKKRLLLFAAREAWELCLHSFPHVASKLNQDELARCCKFYTTGNRHGNHEHQRQDKMSIPCYFPECNRCIATCWQGKLNSECFVLSGCTFLQFISARESRLQNSVFFIVHYDATLDIYRTSD